MPRSPRDEEREQRIWDEAIVDAHDSEEQAMGWYYYLEEKIRFPFEATCDRHRATSPLQPGQRVSVLAMAPEDECSREMFATIQWEDRQLAIPLMQLKLAAGEDDIDDETGEAIEDWRYWVDRGY